MALGWCGAVAIALVLAVSAPSAGAQTSAQETWRAEVFAAERAFARSMADRDIAAFARLVADDTLFFGGRNVFRGKAAVIEGWKAFFDGPSRGNRTRWRCLPRASSRCPPARCEIPKAR
jgi:hypothetical protein